MVGRDPSRVRRAQIRITAVAMVGVVLVLVLASVGLVRLFRQQLVDQVDDQLVAATRYVTDAERADALPSRSAGDELVQFVAADGAVRFGNGSLEGEPALLDPRADTGDEPRTVASRQAGELRVVGVPFRDGLLVLTSSLDDVNAAVVSLSRVLAVGVPVLALALGVLVWFVVGRSLRPVTEAMARERQLVADASHELRSPLAGVRALLETESDEVGEVRRSRRDALATLQRLEVITNDLLLLSVLEDDPGSSQPVDLDELVLRQVHISRSTADVVVDASNVSAGQVVGSSRELERLVESLLSNSTRHAREHVRVGLVEADGEVVLTVADDGGGVPAPDRRQIFERFTRLDEARNRGGGGAGLGLAIVDAVARAHDGTVEVDDDPGLGGARFRVRLPASTSDAPRPPFRAPVQAGSQGV
jgi:signal transduction histidine kinase